MPKKVDEIKDSLMDEGHDEESAWAIAWNNYCENINPDSKHCNKKSSHGFSKMVRLADIFSKRTRV